MPGWRKTDNVKLKSIVALSCLICTPPLQAADEVSVYALFQGKAMLMVDGKRHTLKVGEDGPDGIRLISTNTTQEEAVVEWNGKRHIMRLGIVATESRDGGPVSTTLWASSNGFFHADGSINGVAVTFLVDTGANTIAMNSATARRVGIDYTKGQEGIATTASGYVRSYMLRLATVKVGDIVLHDIAAGVIDGPQPDVPLLGMSFLHRLEMKRDGNRMDLIKKY